MRVEWGRPVVVVVGGVEMDGAAQYVRSNSGRLLGKMMKYSLETGQRKGKRAKEGEVQKHLSLAQVKRQLPRLLRICCLRCVETKRNERADRQVAYISEGLKC